MVVGFLQKMNLLAECLRDCDRALQISTSYAKVMLLSFGSHTVSLLTAIGDRNIPYEFIFFVCGFFRFVL
jgi:hypothetical protein